MVRALVAAKANLNAGRHDGETVLSEGDVEWPLEIMQYLIAVGADVSRLVPEQDRLANGGLQGTPGDPCGF